MNSGIYLSISGNEHGNSYEPCGITDSLHVQLTVPYWINQWCMWSTSPPHPTLPDTTLVNHHSLVCVRVGGGGGIIR